MTTDKPFFERLPTETQKLIVDYILESDPRAFIENMLCTHYSVVDIVDLGCEAGIRIDPPEGDQPDELMKAEYEANFGDEEREPVDRRRNPFSA